MPGLTFIFFHLLFIGFAIFAFGNFYTITYFVLLTVLISALLNFKQLNFFKENIKTDFSWPIVFSVIFVSVVYSLIFAIDGIPIFSDDVNLARVEQMNMLGPFGKVFNISIYFIICYSFIALINGTRKKILFLFLIVVSLILLYLTGFRSRIVDGLFLMIFIYLSYEFSVGFSLKKFLKFFAIFSMPLIAVTGLVIFLTSQRLELDAYEATIEFFRRLFLANYDVNFSRISHYVYQYGNEWGYSFVRDINSVLFGGQSTQEFLTSIFNPKGNSLFVMTMPAFAESYLNFNLYFCSFYALIIFFIRIFIENFIFFLSRLINLDTNVKNSFLLLTSYFLVRFVCSGGISNALVNFVLPVMIFFIIIFIVSLLFNQTKGRYE